MNTKKNDYSKDFPQLSNEILALINQGLPRGEFLKKVMNLLFTFYLSTEIELFFFEPGRQNACELIKYNNKSFCFRTLNIQLIDKIKNNFKKDLISDFQILHNSIKNEKLYSIIDYFNEKSFFKISNNELDNNLISEIYVKYNNEINKNQFKSFLFLPLMIGNINVGILLLKNNECEFYTENRIELFKNFTKTLGISLLNQKTQAALNERVKELTCMYGIAQASRKGTSIDQIMKKSVELLPDAWQYPEITSARIKLDKRNYRNKTYKEGRYKQSADIIVDKKTRGIVEINYYEKKIEIEEGPFLMEERILIDNIAKALALIIEQKQAEDEKAKLHQQILHADRLATIGQLAAGVAHELNEPLANILGFAQLSKKEVKLSKKVKSDLERIEKASLHAREIVKKLLFFAKQMPAKKNEVHINQVIKEGIYFIESRCVKSGIKLQIELEENLPTIYADFSQIMQVLINLLVNSIQAMVDGGTLLIKTSLEEEFLVFLVKDSGHGISDEIKDKIFLPFFTTKNINEGTGLGLSVVHGIVVAHNGKIEVVSNMGKWTTFKIKFPLNNE